MSKLKSVATLPDPIKDLLFSDQFVEVIERIAEKNELRPVYYAGLVRTTAQLLRGELAPTLLITTLSEELNLPRDKAILIAQDLNRDIFNDIKDLLKGIYKDVHVASAPPAKSPSVPTAALPSANVPLARPTGAPIRSDWGWHGTINKATGQIEYKHESVQPETAPKSSLPSQMSTEGPTHVGSIFEQKLGGAFRMKGEAVQYEVAPSPAQDTKGIQGPALRIIPQGRTLDSNPPNPTLRVPHKPTEVKIPPAQAGQPPK